MKNLPLIQIDSVKFTPRAGLIVTARVNGETQTRIYPFATKGTTRTEILNWIKSDLERESV